MEDFEKVYSLYYPDVFKYLLSLSNNSDLAQELTQETFFLAMKSFKNYRGDCKIQVWLCQIAKHSYYAYLKKLKKSVPLDDPDIVQFSESNSLEVTLANESSAMEIHRLLHELPEPQKEVFMLRIFGELSFSKIADIFGKTESWARVTFHRCELHRQLNYRASDICGFWVRP
ncbi:MAG: sigma-70 family RNA polymerase sigma factor [Hespellia sp.]|nr:sigma-70 family RNA polymerase sigma factor [Hespellia sp.]